MHDWNLNVAWTSNEFVKTNKNKTKYEALSRKTHFCHSLDFEVTKSLWHLKYPPSE